MSKTHTRIFTAAVLIAVLTLGISGCGSRPAEITVKVPWGEGDTGRYTVLKEGVKVADWELSVRRENGLWVFTSDQRNGYREYIRVFADAETLVPTKTEYELLSGEEKIAFYTAEYGQDKVYIAAETADGPQEVTVKLPNPPYFDNEQFVMTLRAMPLAEGWSSAVPIIVTRAGQKTTLTVRVVGIEEISVPAGDFTAYKVELKGIGQYGWVSVDPPHELLKWENTAAETVTVLEEYTSN